MERKRKCVRAAARKTCARFYDIALYLLARSWNNALSAQASSYEQSILKTYSCILLASQLREVSLFESIQSKIMKIKTPKMRFAENSMTAALYEAVLSNNKKNEITNAIRLAAEQYRKATADRKSALKEYNNVCYGSDTVPEEKLNAQKAADNILNVLESRGTNLNADEIKTITSLLDEESSWKHIFMASDEIEASAEKNFKDAKDALAKKAESEKEVLYGKTGEDGEVVSEGTVQKYENAVNKALAIDKETSAKLRALALRASDTTLSLTERAKASKEYDELFKSVTGNDKDDEKELTKLAKEAFGKDSFSSKKYYDALTKLYTKYLDEDARIDLNRSEETYYSKYMSLYDAFIQESLEDIQSKKYQAYEIGKMKFFSLQLG